MFPALARVTTSVALLASASALVAREAHAQDDPPPLLEPPEERVRVPDDAPPPLALPDAADPTPEVAPKADPRPAGAGLRPRGDGGWLGIGLGAATTVAAIAGGLGTGLLGVWLTSAGISRSDATMGYVGLALVPASFVVPAIIFLPGLFVAPEVDAWLSEDPVAPDSLPRVVARGLVAVTAALISVPAAAGGVFGGCVVAALIGIPVSDGGNVAFGSCGTLTPAAYVAASIGCGSALAIVGAGGTAGNKLALMLVESIPDDDGSAGDPAVRPTAVRAPNAPRISLGSTSPPAQRF